MTAKETSTWLAIINHQDSLARRLYPGLCPPLPPPSVPAFDASDYDVDIKKRPADPLPCEANLFTCDHPHCPHADYRLGFLDRASRNNHQMACQFRLKDSHDPPQGHQFHVDDGFFSNVSHHGVFGPSNGPSFDDNPAGLAELRFASAFALPPQPEFALDSMPKQDVSLWYL